MLKINFKKLFQYISEQKNTLKNNHYHIIQQYFIYFFFFTFQLIKV
jgi:hypothetical protein